MGKFLLLLILALAILPAGAPVASAEYDYYGAIHAEEDYRELRNLSLRVMEKYPPSEYHYVGLGRSPTPVMAFLREAGVAATNVPLSGLRKAAKVEQFRADLPAFLDEHFALYLPSEKELAGKKILLLDYANEGNTIVEAKQYLAEYLEKAGRKSPLEVLAFTVTGGKNRPALLQKLKDANIPSLAVRSDSWLGESLFESTFDLFAEYGQFPVDKKIEERKLLGRPLEKVARDPYYDHLREELREYMEADRTLRARLKPFSRAEGCPAFFQRVGP